MPTPTFVPTYVPVAGIPLAVTPTPYAVPTSSFDGSNSPAEEDNTGFIILTVALVCVCLIFLLILGVVILTFVVRSQKAGKNG
jgi:hypothetical protein